MAYGIKNPSSSFIKEIRRDLHFTCTQEHLKRYKINDVQIFECIGRNRYIYYVEVKYYLQFSTLKIFPHWDYYWAKCEVDCEKSLINIKNYDATSVV
jgi:hypothetical protein